MKIKDLFNFRKKSEGVPFYPITPSFDMPYFQTGNRLDTKTTDGQFNAYVNCPPVAILITAKATAAQNAQWYFGTEDGQETANQYTKLYRDLFEKPNDDQDWTRFISESYQCNQLFGKAYIRVRKPEGLKRRYATSLEVLPNIYLTENRDIHGTLIDYTYSAKGAQYRIPADEVMVWNDFTVSLGNQENQSGGQSRLYSLSDPVNTVIASYEANYKLLTNYGMFTLLTPAGNEGGVAITLDDNDKKNLQEDMQNNYGAMRGQFPIGIGNVPMNALQLTRPIKDLDLMNTIQDSTRVISESYNFPFHLLGFTDGTTFNNVEIADKRLYTNGIVPELDGFIRTFNQYFNIQSEYQLRFTFDHMDILQDDKQTAANIAQTETNRIISMVNAGLVTANEGLKELKDKGLWN